MAKSKETSFPETIYVWEEEDNGGDRFLLTSRDINDAVSTGEEKLIAIYSFKEKKKAKGIVSLSD